MPHVEATSGVNVLKDLVVNDSWTESALFQVGHVIVNERGLGWRHFPIVDRANALQKQVISKLPERNVMPRPVDKGKLDELEEFIQEEAGGLIIMRHGVQYVEDDARKNLVDPRRKITLMRMPYNDEDPADAQSLAEVASFSLVLKHLARKHNIPVHVVSSRNARAGDMAAMVSFPHKMGVDVDDRLSCVNYSPEKNDEELEKILGSSGALTWNRRILDAACGVGAFDTIEQDMGGLVYEFRGQKQLTVLVTHTPQMNAADVIAEETPVRVKELGFRIFNSNRSQQFPGNIFGNQYVLPGL